MCKWNEWWNFESKLELVGLIQVAAPCGLAHFYIVDKEDDRVDVGHEDLIIADPNETSGACIGGFNVNERTTMQLTGPKRTR